MNQVTLLLFLVIIVAKMSFAFDNEIENNNHIGNHRKNATSACYSTASSYSTATSACYSTKTYHHTMQYINVTKTHCWKETITQTTSPTRAIVPTCTKSVLKVPAHTKKKKTHHPHLKTTTATTITTTKKNAHKSIANAKSRSKSISKSKSASKPRSKASKSRVRSASKSKSRSKSSSKSRQIHSSRMKTTTVTPTPTTTVPATTMPQVAMPTETTHDRDSTTEYDTDDDSTATDEEDDYTTTTATEEATTTPSEAIFIPTSSNNDSVLAAPTNNNDPNDLYINIDAAAGNDISNKALGIGLGVGIGCIAALGLAGLLIHNRKKQQLQAPLNEEAAATVPTRWRPQSFMGVVASVVSKLPRSPSQRSKASTDMLGGATTGIAIGHGEGAVEEGLQQRRQY